MIALTPVEPFEIDAREEARLREVAESFAARDTRFDADREKFAGQFPHRLPHDGVFTLHVDDFSIISNVQDLRAIDGYPSRAFVRIREGDLVAGTFPPIPGYTGYVAERLGLGRSTYLRAKPAPDAITYAGFEALLADDAAQAAIERKIAQDERDVWIHPYMGLEAAWRFGRRMAERSRRRVRLIAPLPTITERANNKIWFMEVVGAVLGEDCALESYPASSVDEICERLREVATGTAREAAGSAGGADSDSGDRKGRGSRIALKLSDSASGQGTGIFEAAEILERSEESLRELVADWLTEHGWDDNAPPVSVEQWEGRVVGSPSIQLWIPPIACDDPGATSSADSPPGILLEGVFDQLFYPEDETVFLGSVPGRLPEAIRNRVGEAGVRIGRVFQHLGYVGRCSFDTILIGDDLADAMIVFTECNGRWGGTSTPMSLMNRLFGDYRGQEYFCRNFTSRSLRGVAFDQFSGKLDDVLFDVASGEGWAIVFNVGCLEPAGKFDLITLGECFEEAERRQEEFRQIVEERF